MEEKLIISISNGLKSALGLHAAQHSMSMSDAARKAIANYIGYDLSKDPPTVRRDRKYNSVEERKEAQRIRSKKHRDTVRELMAEYYNEKAIKEAHAARERMRK